MQQDKYNKKTLLDDLILFLYKKEAIKLGNNFTLSSGKKSKFYLDLRILQSYPKYFRNSILLLKEYIIYNIGLDNFEYICSIPTSGTVFGSSLAYDLFKPHIYVRKTAKEYGTQKIFEGDLIPNSKIIFVDDVVTTGNSLLSSIELLIDKCVINDILVFVDREQGAENLMKRYNIRVHKIISINEIFDILYKNNTINEDCYLDLKKELEEIN